MTKEDLGKHLGVTRRAVTDWESGRVVNPPLEALAELFDVDPDFFCRATIAQLDVADVSFRALSTLGARRARKVVSSARLGLEISEWIDSRFATPDPDVPTADELLYPNNDSDLSPREASRLLRSAWRLEERPVKDMIGLLETHGIRVFSIAREERDVDAFSFWQSSRPFVFLNTEKSAERLRFDLAHELGHLVLHKGVPTAKNRQFELQANEFASAFLMPTDGLIAQVNTSSRQLRLADVMTLKTSWKVSAVAMVRRLFDLKLISDWHYHSWMVELSSMGYRRGEPDGIHREQSTLITSLLSVARQDGMGLTDMAADVGLPRAVIEDAFSGLAFVPFARPHSGRKVANRSHVRS